MLMFAWPIILWTHINRVPTVYKSSRDFGHDTYVVLRIFARKQKCSPEQPQCAACLKIQKKCTYLGRKRYQRKRVSHSHVLDYPWQSSSELYFIARNPKGRMPAPYRPELLSMNT
ncbi:hypothetical protein EJ05DRAFT_269570 [Pseudovirgaria hyperparasitica]|uniref:Zn(2)-C6 fungal-type domain-containing protein n=1 Tax=Pseudovirgaria hyperparasitica TaxID=470096 RepID=A0A6A6VSE1_9PEZI|nr:uncharacterized protein EJ05DRAFT_269570 [Pseudovirgaria hyperparasitica]KAF2752674.1 hypothetical protein EJ05DRAFT_269570 [Pseudovirgaria hyperparasitica]